MGKCLKELRGFDCLLLVHLTDTRACDWALIETGGRNTTPHLTNAEGNSPYTRSGLYHLEKIDLV